MIRRINDFSGMDNKSFEILAQKLNKNLELYDTCDFEDDAKIIKSELQIKGFKSEIKFDGKKYNVYYNKERIPIEEAKKQGTIKRLAWGRCCFQKAHGVTTTFPAQYNFDDGSVWKLEKDENGNEYLVKEIDDIDDDKVLRNKTAGKINKTAADIACIVNDDNKHVIMQILYHNSNTPNAEFLEDILNSEAKEIIYNILADKMNKIIEQKLQLQNLTDEKKLTHVLGLIQKHINEGKIVDENTLESVIYNCIQESMFNGAYSIEQYNDPEV